LTSNLLILSLSKDTVGKLVYEEQVVRRAHYERIKCLFSPASCWMTYGEPPPSP